MIMRVQERAGHHSTVSLPGNIPVQFRTARHQQLNKPAKSVRIKHRNHHKNVTSITEVFVSLKQSVRINIVMLFVIIKNVKKKTVIKDILFNVNMVYIVDFTRKTIVCMHMLL